MQSASFPLWLNMEFPERLTHLRKQKQLTQQALADAVDISATILKRYEAGKAQPTLPVLRRLAIVLGVSGDVLLFDANERGPSDDLRLHFEAVARMSVEDRQVVRSLLEGMILKHDAKRFTRSNEQNA